jgi:hypothetical protein
MSVYVLIEGQDGEKILRAVLPASVVEGLSLFIGSPLGGLTSRARTLLATRHEPVALVLNAKRTDPSVVAEFRKDTEAALLDVAGKTPMKLVLFVPEIESVFFQDAGIVQRLFGDVDRADLVEARFEPKVVLTRLLAAHRTIKSLDQLLASLRTDEIEAIRAGTPVRELLAFLEQVTSAAAV